MTVMISGSIAYDNILSYNGRFSDHLIADSLDHINLTFVTESMTRNYGGCAANIAYALKLLGGDPIVVGAVGTDGSDYLYRFDELDIKTAVSKFNDTYTAQCFITTDLTGSQLATFNPGAMNRAHEQSFPEKENITFALVGPDGRQAMINRVNECVAHKVPFIFDIGQGVSLFNGEEIRDFINKADYVAASAYEMELIERATGMNAQALAGCVKALIVTHGSSGSTVYAQGKTLTVRIGRRRCALLQLLLPSRCKAAVRRTTSPRAKTSPAASNRLTAKNLSFKALCGFPKKVCWLCRLQTFLFYAVRKTPKIQLLQAQATCRPREISFPTEY